MPSLIAWPNNIQMKISVKRNTYFYKGADVFSLELIYDELSKSHYLRSNLPDFIIEQVSGPLEKLGGMNNTENKEKVVEVLNEVASLIVNHQNAKLFFYPSEFLTENKKLISEKEHYYENSLVHLRLVEPSYCSMSKLNPLCFYFKNIYLKAKLNVDPQLKLKAITRKAFEMYISSTQHKNDYIELYFQTKKFIEVESTTHVPSFRAALCKKGNVLICFIDHTLRAAE